MKTENTWKPPVNVWSSANIIVGSQKCFPFSFYEKGIDNIGTIIFKFRSDKR